LLLAFTFIFSIQYLAFVAAMMVVWMAPETKGVTLK